MSDNALDRRRARTMARAAQAAVVLLAGAGVAAVLVLPDTGAAETPDDPLAGMDSAIAERIAAALAARDEGDTAAPIPPDWEGMAYSYHLATDIPFEDEVVEAPKAEGGEETGAEGVTEVVDPPVPPATSSVRFLGRLTVGDRGVALVSVDGQQAFIAEGAKRVVGLQESTRVEVEVVGVGEGEVELLEDGVPYTVSMAERRASAVSLTPEAEPEGETALQRANRGRTEPTPLSRGRRDRGAQPLDREQFKRPDGTIDYEALRAAARARRDEIEAERIRMASERDRENGDD